MNENVINNTLLKRKCDKYVKNCQIHFTKFSLILSNFYKKLSFIKQIL